MIEPSNPLDYMVSYQLNSWSPISTEIKISSVLHEIRTGKFKDRVTLLRQKLSAGDTQYYDSYKKQLPAVTFSATFNKTRTSETIKNYNPLLAIDIDSLDDHQMSNASTLLRSDKHILSLWRSPSNRGYKALISINYISTSVGLNLSHYHKLAFRTIATYLHDRYHLEIDKSGSDVTRLCFISYDEELVINHNFQSFDVEVKDIMEPKGAKISKKTKSASNLDRNTLYNPSLKNKSTNRKLMSDIIRYLTNKGLSITYDYLDWYKVAMAIADSFTYDVGLNYFMKLSAMDKEKFNQMESSTFLLNCYESSKGKITFSTIIYLANCKGYNTKNQKNGVPKAES